MLHNTYRDVPTGLIIRYPDGWRLDRSVQGFAIVNFPLSRRPPQVVVPINGAEISIGSPLRGEKSIDEWLRSLRIDAAMGDHIVPVRVSTRYLGEAVGVIVREKPTVIPEGTQVLYFLNLGGRLLQVSLIYRGERDANKFQTLQKAIIKGLERTGSGVRYR